MSVTQTTSEAPTSSPSAHSGKANARPAIAPSWAAMIEPDMLRVEQMLQEQLQSDIPIVQELVDAGTVSGGKRFRPMLMMLAAHAFGSVKDIHVLLATAIEMIHTATLVHDDILDEASTRRHRPTINAQWGNHRAVLFGDFLFTHAFYLTSTSGESMACQVIGQATNTVCAGELQQTSAMGNYDTSVDEYFEIIRKKTAALCSCATYLGAYYAGATPSQAQSWAQVGENLGCAFQIIDDILDFQGDDQTTGKTLGTDLKTEKATLPILLALAAETPAGRTAWLDKLPQPTTLLSEVVEWLEHHDALQRSFDQATQLVREALQIVEKQPGEAATAFQQLGEFLLKRVH